MKIVFLDQITVGQIPAILNLEKYGDIITYENTGVDQIIERTKEADIIITNKVYIDKMVMDHSPKLKLICIAATGMNNVDLEYAKSKNIAVKNVRDYSTESVAQSTFAMLLQWVNKTSYYDNYVKSGKYAQNDIFTHHGKTFWQISGKQFGIIGMGTIGNRVAAIAASFGARVSYYSTSGKNLKQDYPCISLDELLLQSDILSIHAPLNEKTNGLIGYDELCKMKKEAFILNMGRGGIIDENGLTRALNEDVIAGAALDVYSEEPIRKDNPLLTIQNPEKIVFAPHIAWASMEARTLLLDKICENIEMFLKENNIS